MRRLPIGTTLLLASITAVNSVEIPAVVKGMPGQVKKSVRQFRTGCGVMWQNGKDARTIRKSVTDTNWPDYSEMLLLRRDKEDFAKFLQAGFVWFTLPELCAFAGSRTRAQRQLFQPCMVFAIVKSEARRELPPSHAPPLRSSILPRSLPTLGAVCL